jgi:hypothetical protein
MLFNLIPGPISHSICKKFTSIIPSHICLYLQCTSSPESSQPKFSMQWNLSIKGHSYSNITPLKYHIYVARIVLSGILVYSNPLFRAHTYHRPVNVSGLYQTMSKTLSHIGNSRLLRDNVENTAVKNTFKTVIQITLYYVLKPTDQ